MNLGTWEAQALWAGQGQVMGRDTHTKNSEVAPFPDLYLHHLFGEGLAAAGQHGQRHTLSLQPPIGETPQRGESCEYH